MQHVVGHGESLREGRLLIGDTEQVLVWNNDKRVDEGLKLLDAAFGDLHALLTFEAERLGDDADRQHAHLTHGAGDDRRSARSRAAAHAGGDEDHVRSFDLREDLFKRLFGARAADIGFCTRAEALSDARADLDAPLGLGLGQRLRVGIRDDEIDSLQSGGNHVVDGIAARAADAQHRDARPQFFYFGSPEFDRHVPVS